MVVTEDKKASEGGLWAKEGKAIVNTLINDKWNVMAIKENLQKFILGELCHFGQVLSLMVG